MIECFYGDRRWHSSSGHDAGALMAWQIGSVDEALSAATGCDLVVVGVEAGGQSGETGR